MTTNQAADASDSLVGGGQAAGRWVNPEVSYIDPVRRFCAYCGRPIARRYWERVEDGVAQPYCTPGHAARTTYPSSSVWSDFT